jgi:hypothetical protein
MPYTAGTGETYTTWIKVSDLYPDGRIDIMFNSWSVNQSTGVTTYNIRTPWVGAGQWRGPCEGYCKWKIEGLYGNGQSSELASDSIGGAPMWAYYGSKSGTTTLPLTHIRATLWPYNAGSPNGTYTTVVPVPSSLAEGVDLNVVNWTRDVETGEISYDVGMSIKDAGTNPACQTSCNWKVEAYYDDGTTEQLRRVLGSGTLTGPVGAYGTHFIGSNLFPGEITKLRASVTPAGATEARYTDVVQVSDSYPHGSLAVNVKSWDRDPATGLTTYDLDVSFYGAGQEDGPCNGDCYLYVEGIDDTGATAHSFLTASSYSHGWTATRNLTGTSGTSLATVVEIRARLVPAGGTRETYTDTIPVSDFVLGDINAAGLPGALIEAEITIDVLCIEVEEKARELRIPDSTPSTSTHALTEACLATSSVRGALRAIAAVGGGLAVIGAIIHHYADNDPNADSIAKVPEPSTDVAGSGVRPPTSCLSQAQTTSLMQELEQGNWRQNHHVATDKNAYWTQLYKDLLAENGYADKTLNGSWNVIEGMLHRGTHPPAYHYWVYRNMAKALDESSDWTAFETLWTEWVVDVVDADPTMVRWEWWRC